MTNGDSDAVAMVVTEPRAVPTLSLFFGYGAMVPFLGGAATAWLASDPLRLALVKLTALWGCAILCFLSGVRRGVSFRTMGGPTVTQLATMLWLFCAGFAALLCLALDWIAPSLAFLVVAYASIAVLDPIAARRGEAPLFFARLRPVQMMIPVLGLAALFPLA